MTTTCASRVLSARASKRLRHGIAAALLALGCAAILPSPTFAGAPDRAPARPSEQELERRRGEGDQDYARRLFDRGLIISLEAITKRAKEIRPGELLEVELERKHGRHVYEVEILDTAGQAWELKFDARDGRLLEEEKESD